MKSPDHAPLRAVPDPDKCLDVRPSTLPRRLRLLRAERGLTLVEASKRIGIGRDTLSDLERGRQHPIVTTLSKIAQGYGVPVEDLVGDPLRHPIPTPDELPDVRVTRARREAITRWSQHWGRALNVDELMFYAAALEYEARKQARS